MKSMIVILSLAALCGCSQKSAELERRVQKLEGKCSNLVEIVSGLNEVDRIQHDRKTNLVAFMEATVARAEASDALLQRSLAAQESSIPALVAAELDRHLQARAALFKPGGARPAGPLPAPGASPAAALVREGIPSAVYDQIASKAAQDWPANFTMQKFVIDEEIKAYRTLHGR